MTLLVLADCPVELFLRTRVGPWGGRAKAVPKDANEQVILRHVGDLLINKKLWVAAEARAGIGLPAQDGEHDTFFQPAGAVDVLDHLPDNPSLDVNVSGRGDEYLH